MGEIFHSGRFGTERTLETYPTGLRPYTLYIEGRPHPKERPRFSPTGVPYTPAKTVAAEKAIKAKWDGPLYPADIPLRVDLVFDVMGTAITIVPLLGDLSKMRGDIDNYTKTVLDALNKVAYPDDRQITTVMAVKI